MTAHYGIRQTPSATGSRPTGAARCARVGLILSVLLSAQGGNPSAAEEAEGPLRLTVLSYNIRHGRGLDGEVDLERIAGVIRRTGADIVSLQEVDRNTQRTDRVDQPAELARLTGMEVVFEQNIPHQGGDYGNAILARFPVRAHENRHLPRVGPSEQRGALAAEIELPGGRGLLLLIATHLDHRRDDAERMAAVAVIAEMVAERRLPAVLAGDLNDAPESRVLQEFEAEWSSATAGQVLRTFPADEPARQLDYILFRPAARWRLLECRVVDEPVASDHRPLVAVLELLPAAER